MKRKNLVLLVVLAVVGSFLVYVASDYFFADVGNKGEIMHHSTHLATVTMCVLAMDVLFLLFYLVRVSKRPGTTKRLTKTYAIIGVVQGSLGLLSAFLSGILTYPSFVAGPFAGFPILMSIAHLLILAGCILCLVLRLKRMPEDTETFKVKGKYVFYTFCWGFFALFALNRFGALLVSPTFVHWRSYGITFPYYILLTVPMLLLVIKVLRTLDILKLGSKTHFILVTVSFALSLGLFAYTFIMGSQNTLFISALSPCLPLERIAAMPVETLIHAPLCIGLSGFYFIYVLAFRKAPSKKEA